VGYGDRNGQTVPLPLGKFIILMGFCTFMYLSLI